MIVSGRVLLDLAGQSSDQQEEIAGTVSWTPAGASVELRVDGLPDPAVVSRLRDFGPELRYVVLAADPELVQRWIDALSDPGQAP